MPRLSGVKQFLNCILSAIQSNNKMFNAVGYVTDLHIEACAKSPAVIKIIDY